SRSGGLDHGRELVLPALLQMIRELGDHDAVARDETDERDQAHLTVDVDRRQAEEREEQRAGESEWNGARENDERIAEALELRGQHEVNQDRRQQEDAEEALAFGAQLARLTRVIDREPARQDLRRFLF